MKSDKRAQLTATLFDAIRESTGEIIVVDDAMADILGLSLTEFRCIGLLGRLGPLPAGRLAEMTGLTTGTITAVVDKLEKAGYARRVNDPNDRRVRKVELVMNEETKRAFERMRGAYARRSVMVDAYSDKDLEVLIRFNKDLRKMLQEFKSELDEWKTEL